MASQVCDDIKFPLLYVCAWGCIKPESNMLFFRCDSQAEYNKYLENELKELAEKVKEERIKLRRLQNNSGTEFDEIPDSELKILVARLTREKYELESK